MSPNSTPSAEPRWSPFAHASATLSILLLLLILGPVAGYFAFRQSAEHEQEKTLSEFDEHLLLQVSFIRERTLAVVEALHFMRALFESSEEVTRDEFATFTSDILARQDCVLAAEWIPRIPAERREAHEAAARSDGFPDYILRERGVDGSLRPAGQREEYFPIYFVEPLRRNECAVGFDLGSEPIRRDALRRATRTDEVAFSDPVELVQVESVGSGVLAVLSIREARVADPLGFALIGFRVDDLVRHSLLTSPGAKPSWMQLRLTDIDTGSRPQVIYESEGFSGDTDTEMRVAARDIEVGGQRWRVSSCPTAEFEAAHRTRQPLLFGLTVFLVWELFFGALFFLTRWSSGRSMLNQTRADETVQRLSGALEQTADIVFITDRSGVIEYVNPAFEKVFGYTRSEALGRTPNILKSGKQDNDYYDSLWSTVLSGEVFQAATVNKKKNGELIYIEQTITPMLDPQGRLTHFVSVCKDMTEKRKTEEHETELRLAALVQKKLYPARAPSVRGLDLAGAVFSAEATCGDYFDYIACPDGGMAVAIGDVSGHGLGPALLMAETRAYLRPLLQTHEKLDTVFQCLHRSISEDLEEGRFVTLLAAKFDRDCTGLCYASAGHGPCYLLGSDGRLKLEMGPTGPGLGILDDAEYSMSPVTALEPGDLILLLTDGVAETRAPEGTFFEEEGALDVVRMHQHESARKIVERLHEATLSFAGGESQTDDITIVVVKVKPA